MSPSLPRALASALVGGSARAVALVLRAGAAALRPVARFWWLARLLADVEGEVPVSTQFDGAVETSGRVRLRMGEHCRLGRRVFLETCEEGVISLGSNVRINAGTFLVAYAEISIGSDTLVGEYVSIRDADHGVEPGAPIRAQPHRASPISIGEGVWIGRGAVILKGVTIGDGAVVAANSVVTRDVAPMAIVAGAPARELRRREASEPRGASASQP